ncbi:FAD-containing oxidoreductase [Scleromatobacter humisilvae]|uniref:FAD-containing oxidoreductase n=1 Tax=Scleromatobacter humisilvae TaxID=2897159 RepID=A0A9X1YME9_9BURK|nr:FAD-containing oxidoreductase [Scleromatobacter humisilvae]MCK9687463.1 FAD-containing oxidoreductase [Scleromatobacter humisilvae]
MTSTPFDALVIGSGQAGPSLAVRLAEHGWRTALVERGELGGTCVNNGCTPTKTLVASARAAWVAKHAADFGVRIAGEVSIDYAAVHARMMTVVQGSRDGLGHWIAGTANLSLVHGEARFVGADSVQVGEQVLQAPRIFLNVGARPVVPDWVAASGVPYLTSESLMGLRELPSHLVILGAGYISLEYAQVYARFGSQVTIIEHGNRLLPREDDEVAATVKAVLERDGVRFMIGANATALERDGTGVALVVDGQRVGGSHVLVAIGRRPNVEALDLARAGVTCDAHGIVQVDEQLRTSVPGIWALGDVNGRGAFTHTSYNDYEIVAANLLDGDPRRVGDRVPAYALYTDPPLARIGMSRAAARQSGKRVLVGHLPMSRVGRARERGETDGFLEALVDADTQRILGATLLGIEADEAVHCLLDVMSAGLPYTAISRTMHIHPTVSELIPTMLQSLKPLE